MQSKMINVIVPESSLAVGDIVVYTTPQGIEITNCQVTRFLSGGSSTRVLHLDTRQSYSGLLTQMRKTG